MADRREEGMSLIVKTVTRLTLGLILLYGLYIVLHGHLTPGGGFAGGVIVALSLVHLVLAFGGRSAWKRISHSGASVMEATGALGFLALALLGLTAGFFLSNFLPEGRAFQLFSAGSIPLANLAICLKVGGGLFAVFAILTIFTAETASPDGGER
mgnify:FL=1